MTGKTTVSNKLVLSFKNALGNTVSLSLVAPGQVGYQKSTGLTTKVQTAAAAIIASNAFGKQVASSDEGDSDSVATDYLVKTFTDAKIVTTDTTVYDFAEVTTD